MKLKIIALACVMALPYQAYAAVFTITNNSGAPISQKPTWSGDNEKFVSLTPGQSASYNSGFNNLDTITWEQRLDTSDAQKKEGIICLKRFVASLNIIWSAFVDRSVLCRMGIMRIVSQQWQVQAVDEVNQQPYKVKF